MKRVSLFLVQTLMSLTLVFMASCSDDDKGVEDIPGVNKPPTCSITNPQSNAQFNMDEAISVTVVAEDSDGTIAEVQLYIDNVGHSLKAEFPYNFTINAGELTPGTHTLKAVAKDNEGAKVESTINIKIKHTEYTVGMSSHGGKVLYVDDTGQHGLIAAPSDEMGLYTW